MKGCPMRRRAERIRFWSFPDVIVVSVVTYFTTTEANNAYGVKILTLNAKHNRQLQIVQHTFADDCGDAA